MANTYTWSVRQCERNLADGMITTMHYTISAVTEDGVYSAGAYGSIGLEAADPSAMIPYDNVTEAQAISWVQEKIGGEEKVSEIHAALDKQLTEKRTPTTGQGVPWQ